MKSNEAILKDMTLPFVSKAEVNETNLPNSVLNREQSDAFLDLVRDYTNLLKRVRYLRHSAAKGEINKLDFAAIVTQGASATTSATTRIPTETRTQWDTVKYRSALDLASDFVEDNLEGRAIRNKLIKMLAKRVAIDTEYAGILGDSSLTTGDGESDSNNLLGVNDGIKKILDDNVPAAQQIDAAGAAPSKDLYYDMINAIPARYRIKKPDYVWVVSSTVFNKWVYDWTGRVSDGGDAALRTGMAPGPFGIPMLHVPLMPEDLSYGSAVSDATVMWLTPLDNLAYIVQREVTMEWEREPRSDVWEFTLHFRCDFQVVVPAMVVLAENISISGTDYTT